MSQLLAGMSLQVPPLLLSTLVKHFLSRKKITADSKARDELLYDEAFMIVKRFLDTATKFEVEALQQFSNTRIPAPPTVTSIRLLIPPSCCDDAAAILIRALGGEEKAKEVAGGTRWWQVRGIAGVDANWVANKKEWNRAKRNRDKSEASARNRASSNPVGSGSDAGAGADPKAYVESEENGEYTPDMDLTRCMLYFHGGGYFFGSTDQERFCVQRYARKMNGRVFAVNYRLAPQYPFPCQIQDAVAAYLYLIRPPPGALHKPVSPSQIILNGNSAGGGLVIALLQVIRDTGLPMPAGAILVSPWCDLTHSFPSTTENTATDVIPRFGLSIYKPSALWPPPPDDMAQNVRTTVADKFRTAVYAATGLSPTSPNPSSSHPTNPDDRAYEEMDRTSLGDTRLSAEATEHAKEEEAKEGHAEEDIEAPARGEEMEEGKDYYPMPTRRGEPIRGKMEGKVVELTSQIQLYAMNHQLTHPLISSVNGYLGGLCPLFIMASDKEVIRDEIIYMSHKAANPEKYTLKPEMAELYPAYKGIEGRYGPTDVHLQVYDETCHVLPLFTFTTPAIYSYRAMAAFCKFVTKDPIIRSPSMSAAKSPMLGRSVFASPKPSQFSAAAEHPVEKSIEETLAEHRIPVINAPIVESPEKQNSDPLDRKMTATPMTTSDRSDYKSFISDESRSEGNGSSTTPPTSDGPESKPSSVPSSQPSSEVPTVESTPNPATSNLHIPPKKSNPISNVTLSPNPEGVPLRRLSMSVFRNRRATLQASPKMSGVSSLGGSDLPPTPVQPWARNQAAHPELETHGTKSGKGYAGHAFVYADAGGLPFPSHMIRERVATNGQIRPLEPESDLTACNWPPEMICVVTSPTAKRYLEGQAIWDERYAKAAKKVAKVREKHVREAQKEVEVQIKKVEGVLRKASKSGREGAATTGAGGSASKGSGDDIGSSHALLNTASFSMAWALEGEYPPPSSLVGRRDTAEARRLALLADVNLTQSDSRFSGNNLWAAAVNMLSGSSKPDAGNEDDDEDDETPPPAPVVRDMETEAPPNDSTPLKKKTSVFRRMSVNFRAS